MKLAVGLMCFFAFCCPGPLESPAQTTAMQAVSDQQPGVVVEKVDKDSDAEKFGFAPGDLILRWTRGESSGTINSPLDLLEIELEELPQGEISLAGRRGAEERIWLWTASKNIQISDGDWGLTMRPYLRGSLLESYQGGQTAAETGKAEEAAHLWQAIAADESLSPLLRTWLLWRSAQSLIVAKQWSQADADCQKAARLSQTADLRMLRLCADAFADAHQYETSEKYFRQAIAEIQSARPQSLTAASLLAETGRLFILRRDSVKAKELFAQALDIQKRLAPESLVTAANLHTLGSLFFRTDDVKKAEQMLESAVAIRQRLAPESAALARSLQLQGDILTVTGDTGQALSRLLRAVEILQRVEPDSWLLAGCLVDASSAVDDTGDMAKAENLLRQALAIQKKLGGPKGPGFATSLNNLGLILMERGQLAQAEAAFRESLALRKEIAPESPEMGNALGNLAIVESELGHFEEAERLLNQCIAIHQKVGPAFQLADDYLQAGDLALLRGDLNAAEASYRQGLETAHAAAPDGPEEGNNLHGLGDVASKKGDNEDAEKNYRRALEIRKKAGPATWRYAQTLLALAQVVHRSHKPEAAAELFQQGFDVLENQTNRLGGDSQARAGFRSEYDAYYKSYISLLIEQGKPELAFQMLERSRGRTLLETLATAHIDIRTGVDPELIVRERSLQADIRAKSERHIHLLSDQHTDEQINALEKEISNVTNEYQSVEGQIRATSPAYAALTQPQPMSTKEVEQLLDAETLLLEYSLGDEHSYVFAVTSDSVAAYKLPRKTEIEAMARQIYQAWTAQNRIVPQESALQRQARLRKENKNSASALAQLSRVILGPVADQLKGKRLLVVSDGALQYIPFAALPSPDSLTTRLDRDRVPPGDGARNYQSALSLAACDLTTRCSNAKKGAQGGGRAG